MKAFFKELFEYNHHVNQQLVVMFNNGADKISDKAVKLFSHILNAHQIWNTRIEPGDTLFGVWTIHNIEKFEEIENKNFKNVLLIIDKYDPGQLIHLPAIKGKSFTKTIGQLLFHVINHSTYHRGQIATEFRLSGVEPLASDYFLYDKEENK